MKTPAQIDLRELIGIDVKSSSQIIDYLLNILTSDDNDLWIGDIVEHWRSEFEKGNLSIKEFSFACYMTGFITSDFNCVEELLQVYQTRKNFNNNKPHDIN